MDRSQLGPVSPLGPQERRPLNCGLTNVLLNSHFPGAGMPELESGDVVRPHRWSARSRVRAPLRTFLSPSFSKPALKYRNIFDAPTPRLRGLNKYNIDLKCSIIVSWPPCSMCVLVSCSFHFRNISRKERYIKKKIKPVFWQAKVVRKAHFN